MELDSENSTYSSESDDSGEEEYENDVVIPKPKTIKVRVFPCMFYH